MPFKKNNIKKIIEEKRSDEDFDNEYSVIKSEYDLIRQIVEFRKLKGLTQKDISLMVGVSQQEISRFEREKHIPNLTNFIKILTAVGLEIILVEKQIQ